MSRMATTALLAAITLAGCAVPAWHKAGATQHDFDVASYQCERDTRQASASFSYGLAGMWQARDFAHRCMVARGFVKAGS